MAASSRGKAHISDLDLKLFVKDVDDPHSRKRPLTIKSWSTVKDIKDHIQKLLHVPPSSQRLYFGPLMTKRAALPNHWTVQDAGIYRNGETLYLEIINSRVPTNPGASISTLKAKSNDICVSKALLPHTSKPLRRLVQQARRGMAMGLKPNLVLDGSGGTYFLHDARKVRVAVFKPADEEPYAENNPRGHVRIRGNSVGDSSESNSMTMSMRNGIQPGEACLREVAAFLLDHDGFSGVPLTTLAEARHPAFHQNGAMLTLNQGGAAMGSHSLRLGSSPLEQLQSCVNEPIEKVGSFQEYIYGECCMDDISPSKITTEEVHKIAVLDIRIMNADRNTANLICRRDPENPDFFELVPIDHGYCLRTAADVCWFDWCWLDWPQLKQPVSQRTRDYILKLDIEEDARMLKESLNIPDRALDYFRASSKLLQAGIRCGMSLYDIAVLCCRNDDAGELPSRLETLISMADEISRSAIDNGRWHHTAASRALEQHLSPELMNRGPKFSKALSTRMFKSQSSMNFSSFLSEKSNNPPTPMAQSSESDSSSVTDQASADDEECSEWAASFIANTLEPSVSPKSSASRRQRSISFARGIDDSDHPLVGSNHSISSASCSESVSSPVGFWHVPPGTSNIDIDDDDNWSPHASPHVSGASPSSRLSKDLDMDSLEIGKGRIVNFDLGNLIPPLIQRLPAEHECENNDHVGPSDAVSTKMSSLALKRSNSYSEFHFKRISDSNDIQPRTASKRDNSEKLQHYFDKFIDLLIDREITPIYRSRQVSMESNSKARKKQEFRMEKLRMELERSVEVESVHT